jgi:hypothetical protein
MYQSFLKRVNLIVVAILFLSITHVKAQPTEPDPLDPGGPQSGAVPLDAGLTILLAAGAGYGAKKAYDYRKKKKVESEK